MVDQEELRIPLIEEQVRISKREVELGRVYIHTSVQSRQELVEAALTHHEASVERVPIGRVVETAPAMREEGDILIIPVLEERLVIRTELVLKEEIRVVRRVSTETVRTPVTVRSMQAEVERREVPSGSQASPTGGTHNG